MEVRKQNLQAEIAEFIATLRYECLPPAIVEDAKYRLLDWLGSALAGVGYKSSLIIAKMVKSSGGTPQATMLKAGVKVPVAQAALANGLIGHVAEYDDGHRLAIAHPGAVTVPVALALAEGFDKSGKDLLTAIVAGYEVLIRLGAALSPSHYRIWHTTGTCGTFAAAASAASLLQLDQQKTQMALGIAGTMASGLQAAMGTDAKPLNAGHACQSGVQAALLAQDGFTGAEDILLNAKGFIAATTLDYNLKPVEQISEQQFLSNTAFYKIYASCGHTNSPLDAIFSIMRQHDIALAAVKAVRVSTYRTSVDLTGQLKNQNEENAKFSLPYCIAVALLYKRVTLAEFATEKLNDPLIMELASKVRVLEDPEATKAFPQRRATVEIELNDGQVISEKVLSAQDTPIYEAIEEKFLSLAQMSVDCQSAKEIRNMVLHLEKLTDIHGIMKLVQ